MTKEELMTLAAGGRLDGEAYSRQALARDLLAAQSELGEGWAHSPPRVHKTVLEHGGARTAES